MLGEIAWAAIEKERTSLNELSLKMWTEPETAFKEVKAAQWVADYLAEKGFTVTRGTGGVPTAVKAVWGSGKPIIGFLGELDALPGLSQKLQSTKEPAAEGAPGHGCGHNLLGVGHIGAAIGAKAELEASGSPGTIVYYGCPAEEVLTGKGFMARGGAFDQLDVNLSYHPGRYNEVDLGDALGLNSVEFKFHGITAHAGGDPHNGRSALDAVELTNVGANYLREHVKTDVRIHYVITNGGMAPNIVPDEASVWYYVRAPRREAVAEVYERLIKVARGAAMMTETELEIDYGGGCYPTLNNHILGNLIMECFQETPRDSWTEEELAFAKSINQTCEPQYSQYMEQIGPSSSLDLHVGEQLIHEGNAGSTDVGDVEHICPGITFTTACYASCVTGHSWQITACSGSSIGEKGMTLAARVMALAALKLAADPEILKAAQEEFQRSTSGKKYVCPIPQDLPVPGL